MSIFVGKNLFCAILFLLSRIYSATTLVMVRVHKIRVFKPWNKTFQYVPPESSEKSTPQLIFEINKYGKIEENPCLNCLKILFYKAPWNPKSKLSLFSSISWPSLKNSHTQASFDVELREGRTRKCLLHLWQRRIILSLQPPSRKRAP